MIAGLYLFTVARIVSFCLSNCFGLGDLLHARDITQLSKASHRVVS